MEYQIRDIAELLNISKQMVRYYEQNGVITPKRMEGNNYRVYDVLDYFALGEAISLSRFNINIKDIYELTANDYTKELSKCYRNYIKETDEELAYKSMLKERAEELLKRTESAELNVGNVWIKRIPEHRLYPLVKGHNDDYGPILIPKEVRSALSNSALMPFGEGVIELEDGFQRWWIGIQEKYAKHLEIPFCEACITVPEHYSVCVIINMGEIGGHYVERIEETIANIHQMNYEFAGKPQGMLLCRGSQNNEFHRLLEIQVPIRKP